MSRERYFNQKEKLSKEKIRHGKEMPKEKDIQRKRYLKKRDVERNGRHVQRKSCQPSYRIVKRKRCPESEFLSKLNLLSRESLLTFRLFTPEDLRKCHSYTFKQYRKVHEPVALIITAIYLFPLRCQPGGLA